MQVSGGSGTALDNSTRIKLFYAVRDEVAEVLEENQSHRDRYSVVIDRVRARVKQIVPAEELESTDTNAYIDTIFARQLLESLYGSIGELTADQACSLSLTIGNEDLDDGSAELCFTRPYASMTETEKITIRVISTIDYAFDIKHQVAGLTLTILPASTSNVSALTPKDQLILLTLLSLSGEKGDRLDRFAANRLSNIK